MGDEEEVKPAEEAAEQASAEETSGDSVELQGLFALKKGMSAVYGDKGEQIPVTVLQFEPWVVSEIKTKEKHGYDAVQVAARPKKAKNSSAAQAGHLQSAGFENGARWIKEVRQTAPEGVKVGQRVDLASLKAGDRVRISGRSKGRGFSGAMKRHGFGGGPASHGSGFHRKPGSIGNCTWPGRVMPGRKMPGQYGNEKVTVPRALVVDVLPDENVLLIKGPVPGARNSLVQLMKV